MSLIRQKRPNPLLALPANEEEFSELRRLARKTITPTSATTPSVAVYGQRGSNMICLLTPTALFFDEVLPENDILQSPTLTALFCDLSHRKALKNGSNEITGKDEEKKSENPENSVHALADNSTDSSAPMSIASLINPPDEPSSTVDDLSKLHLSLSSHDDEMACYESTVDAMLPAGATGFVSILDNNDRLFRVRYNPTIITKESIIVQWQHPEDDNADSGSNYFFTPDESLGTAMQMEICETIPGLTEMIFQGEPPIQLLTPPSSLDLHTEEHLKGYPLKLFEDEDIASTLDSLPHSDLDVVTASEDEDEDETPEKFTPRDPNRPIMDQIVEGSELWIKLIQVKKGLHTCSHCTNKFTTLLDLAKHLDEHKIVRQFFCCHDDCPWKLIGFQRRPQCARHLKTLHGRGFICPHCQKKVIRKDSLRRHIFRVHLDAKPRGPYNTTGKKKEEEGEDDFIDPLLT